MMKENVETAMAYWMVLSVQAIFAIYQLMAKVAFERYAVDPLVFAFTRTAGASMVLFLMSAVLVPWHKFVPREGYRWQFLLMGVSMFGNVVGLVFALSLTSSASTAMLQVLRPIFAGILSWTLGLEKPTMLKVTGMAICVVGGMAVTEFSDTANATARQPYLGALLVCLHALSISVYVVHQPILVEAGHSAIAINAISYAIATLFIGILIAMPSLRAYHHGIWFDGSPLYICLTLHSIFLVASWSYVTMAWSARRLGGTVVMLFMLLQMVCLLIAGRYVLGEVIHPGQAAGGLLVVVGILIFAFAPSTPTVQLWTELEKGRKASERDKLHR